MRPIALFQPDGVPGDVEVDHEPAELEVDSFAGGLGRDQNLSRLLELALGVDARAGRVAVADLHAAVNLRDDQSPLAELAERATVLAVAREVIERVLVLGEDQQLHLRIVEDAVLGEDAAELGELGCTSWSRGFGLVDQGREPGDFLAEHGGIGGKDFVLELSDAFAAARPRAVRRSHRGCGVRSVAAVRFGVFQDLLAAILHSFQAAADGVDD